MVSADEIRVLDKNAAFFGMPTIQLMENAGKGVAAYVSHLVKPGKQHVLVICGLGNNGGDGFVAARHLSVKFPVTVLLLGDEQDIRTSIARSNYYRLTHSTVKILTLKDLNTLPTVLAHHEIIIDALLGIGVTGELRYPYDQVVQLVQKASHALIISIDVPSGIGTHVAIKPDHTVTFHAMKDGMNQDNSGKIKVVDIGIPKAVEKQVGPGELAVYYPRSKPTSHKRDNGVVLIVGGGPYFGAPALTGMAAHRTGTDLVHIATPKSSADVIAGFSPNFIMHPLTNKILTVADMSIVQNLLPSITCLIIGPGLGTAVETKKAVQDIIKATVLMKKPIVVDADAIGAVAEIAERLQNPIMVITPHAGEFERLTGTALPKDIEACKKLVATWAKQHHITILLKGPTDIISDGKQIKINTTHNEAMTVGGTGDVLAGIVGALL
ncbi:MAG: NAD(P)H-hydrate dehydratase, partial [Candidatus Thermoplasmatota archaeon]|nr:NAD(P)H-hydrate dehydratase [Candidatus Thermoplasmatota archaeon]